MVPETTHEAAAIDEDVLRYQFVKKKGYVRLHTSKGDLNLELHCDMTPKTCENFIRLCKKQYYDGTIFHRSIRNFVIQGGDPTGTGTGGESFWGKPFRDEFRPNLSHTGRGILSMANSGPNTNKSQFFITFRSCAYLDKKHTIFGRVVGGFDTLTAMENVESDPKTDRPKEEIRIDSTTVFVDPFEEADIQIAEERKKTQLEEAAPESTVKKSQPKSGSQGPPMYRQGVGKYISPAATKRVADEEPSTSAAVPVAKKKPSRGFTDFSSCLCQPASHSPDLDPATSAFLKCLCGSVATAASSQAHVSSSSGALKGSLPTSHALPSAQATTHPARHAETLTRLHPWLLLFPSSSETSVPPVSLSSFLPECTLDLPQLSCRTPGSRAVTSLGLGPVCTSARGQAAFPELTGLVLLQDRDWLSPVLRTSSVPRFGPVPLPSPCTPDRQQGTWALQSECLAPLQLQPDTPPQTTDSRALTCERLSAPALAHAGRGGRQGRVKTWGVGLVTCVGTAHHRLLDSPWGRRLALPQFRSKCRVRLSRSPVTTW
ncbi:peptidylprolyl isomerase like 2 [Phyllostomus discolor]|uniref:Peptidylprolyl isomerase like 2 n=1 Tax=Phyllostomus discolor TaxID=89673 RepID=A0A833YUR5_9CHIR|nr:peptidylprolyl isomerase like 2 [Phyllostomus discolor]